MLLWRVRLTWWWAWLAAVGGVTQTGRWRAAWKAAAHPRLHTHASDTNTKEVEEGLQDSRQSRQWIQPPRVPGTQSRRLTHTDVLSTAGFHNPPLLTDTKANIHKLTTKRYFIKICARITRPPSVCFRQAEGVS